MKAPTFIVLLFLAANAGAGVGLQSTDTSVERWQAVGPTYSNVYVLKRDPLNPTTLLAGVFYGGLYRSSDEGRTWSIVTAAFSAMSVQAIAFDPWQRGVVYIGTFNGGVYKTQDGTASWDQINDGLTDLNVLSLAVDPFNPNFVIAACKKGIYTSHNAGAHWDPLGGNAGNYQANTVLFNPQHRGAVYIGTTANGVLVSLDGGDSWQDFSQGIENSTIIALNLNASATFLYATATDGAFRRPIDSGSWENLTLDLPTGKIALIQPSATDPNGAFALTYKGVFRLVETFAFPNLSIKSWVPYLPIPSRLLLSSDDGTALHLATITAGLLASFDGGATWTFANTGMQNLFVGALATAVGNGQSRIYAGSDAGVFVGFEKGTIWKNDGHLFQTVFALEVDPISPYTVFAGTEHNGLWRSIDGGSSWNQFSDGLVPPQILSIAQSPFPPYTLYAGAPSGLFSSADGAANWTLATSVPITSVLTTAADPYRRDVLYLGDGDGHVYVTFGGANFIEIDHGLPHERIQALRLTAIANGPAAFCLTSGGTLFLTTNEGADWNSISDGIGTPVLTFDFDAGNPNTIYAGTQGSGVFKTTSGGQTWELKNKGLMSPFIDAIAVDPQDSATVYAATRDGVYKSQDAGESWRPGGTLPPGTITAIFCDQQNDAFIYVLVRGAGIFTSRDRGESWKEEAQGLPQADVLTLAVNPSNAGQLYAGTVREGIFTSKDGGQSWVPVNNGLTLFVAGIAIDSKAPTNMYVSTLFGGVFKSIDGGRTWENTGLNTRALHKIAVATDGSRSIYVGTSSGTARSTDGGSKWTILGQQTNAVFSMASNPRDSGVVYIGGPNGRVFRSSDGGQSWDDLPWGLPAGNVNALAVSSRSSSIFVAVSGHGVYRVAGSATKALVLDEHRYGYAISSLVVDDLSGTVWAASEGAGVLESTDNGSTWNFRALGFISKNVLDLAQDPASRNVLYAGTDGGLFKTTDWGVTWHKADNGIDAHRVYNIEFVPGNSSQVFAGTSSGIFRSDDGGATWRQAGDLFQGVDVSVILVHPSNPANIYAGTLQFGMFRSNDGGVTWATAGNGLQSGDIQTIQLISPGILLAGTIGAGVQRSVDGGLNWSGGLNVPVQPPIQVLALNPLDPSTVYAGTAGVGVLKTVDQGTSWTASNEGLDDLDIFSIAVDPIQPATIYVGTHSEGVFASDDSGQHWQRLPTDGLFNQFITSLAVDPLDHLTIYAGTEGGGVFRFTRSGLFMKHPAPTRKRAGRGGQ